MTTEDKEAKGLFIERVNSFILKVFNYYNGKINTFNRAVLQIDWHDICTSAVGESRNPNTIIVKPMAIFIYYGDTTRNFLYNIIACVIHELFHTDQIICYPKYADDIDYKNIIEDTVYKYTYLYIADHQDEIYRNFGVKDEINYKNYYPSISKNCPNALGIIFQRRNYFYHLLSIFQDLTGSESNYIVDKFVECYNNNYSIYVIIEDEFVLTIKEKNKDITNGQLLYINSVFEDKFFKKINNHIAGFKTIMYDEEDKDNNTLTIKINMNLL